MIKTNALNRHRGVMRVLRTHTSGNASGTLCWNMADNVTCMHYKVSCNGVIVKQTVLQFGEPLM